MRVQQAAIVFRLISTEPKKVLNKKYKKSIRIAKLMYQNVCSYKKQLDFQYIPKCCLKEQNEEAYTSSSSFRNYLGTESQVVIVLLKTSNCFSLDLRLCM